MLTLDRGAPLVVEVVGVTRDVRELSRRLPPSPGIYVPRRQQPWLGAETRELVVRTQPNADPSAALQQTVRELEPDVPLAPVERLTTATQQPNVRARLYASATAIFAAVAIVLAGFGLYGAVALAIAERTRTIGIAVALGATPRRVVADAARYGLIPSLIGVVAGVPMAFGAGHLVRQQLFEVQPTDPYTVGAVVTLFATMACAGSIVPALRARRIDPAAVLRRSS
jgi:putative ABC transport system permease protein